MMTPYVVFRELYNTTWWETHKEGSARPPVEPHAGAIIRGAKEFDAGTLEQ